MPTDTVATETTQQTAPETPVQGNPTADAARRALYEKHYGGAPADSSTDATTSPADSASAAQADQTSVVPETVVTSTEPETPPAESTQLVEVLRAMQEQLAAQRAEIAALKAPRPDATATSTATQVEAPWVTALRNGDIVGAEKAMAEAVGKIVKEQLSKPLVEEAETRTVERMQAYNEVESFVKDLRSSNQDIIELEGWITLDAQQRLARVQQSGSIKTTGDAVREYKKAVLEATNEARKVAQKLRGSGKSEAMVRNREVLSASTLPPQSVDTNRSQGPAPDATPEPESTQSYFEKRRAAENSRRGLAV